MAATASRLPPNETDPAFLVPVPNDLRPVLQYKEKFGEEYKYKRGETPPGYFPQPETNSEFNYHTNSTNDDSVGCSEWKPYFYQIVGTTPVVDKYSLTRFGEQEWRKRNYQLLKASHDVQENAKWVEWETRSCIDQVNAEVDQNQRDNTNRLAQRSCEIFRWKYELERSIGAVTEELQLILEARDRLQKAMKVILLPASIAGECIEKRTSRLDDELVRDDVEEELIVELSLTKNIKERFLFVLKQLQIQFDENKRGKQRLEADWSDKKQAHAIESINTHLNNRSGLILFRPGSVRVPEEQSSVKRWDTFTKDILQEVEASLHKSVVLRGTLDAILLNAARDIRTQADKVDICLTKRISCTEEIKNRLERELKQVLRQLLDIETLIPVIQNKIRLLDFPIKNAQTRLNNRILYRQRVENCRDSSQQGLIEEVKIINDGVSALRRQVLHAEETQRKLVLIRNDLEREILIKNKTLVIDKHFVREIRYCFPSINSLTGY